MIQPRSTIAGTGNRKGCVVTASPTKIHGWRTASWGLTLMVSLFPLVSRGAQPQENFVTNRTGTITSARGAVQHSHAGQPPQPARIRSEVGVGDTVETLLESRAAIELKVVLTTIDLIELTRVRFLPGSGSETRIVLPRGGLHVTSRGQPRSLEIRIVEDAEPRDRLVALGTDFAVMVDPERRRTEVALFDGTIEVGSKEGPRILTAGSLWTLEPGAEPRPTPLFSTNVVQWWIYFPGVLDPDDLELDDPERAALEDSLRCYRQGDLLGALRRATMAKRLDEAPTASVRVYRAALLLSAGAVRRAIDELSSIERGYSSAIARSASGKSPSAMARALRRTLRAVSAPFPGGPDDESDSPVVARPSTATEAMARSYVDQSRLRLADALDAARVATVLAPDFGFAWARLAELEFAHGRIVLAREAIQRALLLSPSNAPAHAVSGFIQAAENRTRGAEAAFEHALRLDPGFPDAWLGRGLVRIRRGQLAEGREDLRTAATLEPRRSLLRAYAGKAFADSGDSALAGTELAYAARLDPRDPTPFLYLALQDQRENRMNSAVSNLAKSLVLNTNRGLYRSEALLDRDMAVRRANLASIFAEAGRPFSALSQATRALETDYSNPAAHLFLANSYNALRDSRQIDLRYDTPWFTEYLLANLLSPVGAGGLSPTVSLNDYGRFFQRDGLTWYSETRWTSNGDWAQAASQTGQFGAVEYAFDLNYSSGPGEFPNGDFRQTTVALRSKVQLGHSDAVFLQGVFHDFDAGDLSYESADGLRRSQLRQEERQWPDLLAGYRHEWSPDVHSMLLVGPWVAATSWDDPEYLAGFAQVDVPGAPPMVYEPITVPARFANRFEGFTLEGQQLIDSDSHTLVVGARFQEGLFDTHVSLDTSTFLADEHAQSLRKQASHARIQRWSAYVYDQWRLAPRLALTLGLAYDDLEYPVNITVPPISYETHAAGAAGPKAGLRWEPWDGGLARMAFAESLSGMSMEQSYSLEPSQVAGLLQSFRGTIPGYLGLIPAQSIRTAGWGFEQEAGPMCLFRVGGAWDEGAGRQGVGMILAPEDGVDWKPYGAIVDVDFREVSCYLSVERSMGSDFAVTGFCRIADTTLEREALGGNANAEITDGVLGELVIRLQYNHPWGVFGAWESRWTVQSIRSVRGGTAEPWTRDDFARHDIWLGRRFWRRRAELAFGVLNLTDDPSQLHPIHRHHEPYRTRTYAAIVRFIL